MKKQLIIYVLRLLESQTNRDQPMTQTQMAKIISAKYPCDRKTVCRNIRYLQEMGFPIVKTTKGFYMDGMAFSFDEIEFVKSAILNATALDGIDRASLADKTVGFLSKRYDKRL